jgi:lysosomal Pro-X carboxypeptidase
MQAEQQRLLKYGAISVTIDNETVEEQSCPTASERLQDVYQRQPRKRAWLMGATGGLLLIAFAVVFGNNKTDSSSLLSFISRKEYVAPENRPLFYSDQPVDHFNDFDTRTWSNRYYESTKYFKGAGHPIFMVVGGEGALDHGMLYPFVTEVLAKRFGAAVLQIEHRFYGPYPPVRNPTKTELLQLLTPHQAMADMVQLTNHVRHHSLGCSADRTSKQYCPIITVGGSYPGFLSAMFRVLYPSFADMAYASSAPLLMYAQISNPDSYYDIVTSSAERASPGCPNHVRMTLDDMSMLVEEAETLEEAAKALKLCPQSLPKYIETKDDLRDNIVQLVAFAFADFNMMNYPPGPKTGMAKVCHIFQDPTINSVDTLIEFYESSLQEEDQSEKGCDLAHITCPDPKPIKPVKEGECFDMMKLEDSDASGEDKDGEMWNFQTCSKLIFLAGYSTTSMLPPREATYEQLTEECHEQFGDNVTPDPYFLIKDWDFLNRLEESSNIIFTNGVQDMWAGTCFFKYVVVFFALEFFAHTNTYP